jgi:putative salt-induced outer membrane protein YdiY
MKFLIAASLLLCACSLWADQVTLANGDRFTGSVLRSDTKTLVIKTDAAGEVTLKWDSITAISAPGPLHIGLSDGQTIVGSVETVNGRFNITTKTAGVVATSKESIQFIRNNDEQTKVQAEIDHFRNPRLVDLWVGNLDLGFAASRGNANTATFTLATNAQRATTRDKIAVYYTSSFSSSDFSSGISQTTANSKRGGVSYNLNLDEKAFAFGSVELESDQFQSLDLRFVPSGGAGYHAIATMPTQLDLRVGAAANREFFSTGLNRTSAELLLGEDLAHKFTGTTSVEQKFAYFANLSDAGAYRLNFDISAVTAIRKWFSWQFTVSDRFLSNPVAGRKKNDILFSTGVRLNFAK